MGMQSGRIKNHKITSASEWDRYHGPYLARLNRNRRGRYMGAWSAKYNNHFQWLQVDFGRAAKIIKMSTQGRQNTNQWVTQYYVTRSLDAVHFMHYKERNNIKVQKRTEWLSIHTYKRCFWERVLMTFRLLDGFHIIIYSPSCSDRITWGRLHWVLTNRWLGKPFTLQTLETINARFLKKLQFGKWIWK